MFLLRALWWLVWHPRVIGLLVLALLVFASGSALRTCLFDDPRRDVYAPPLAADPTPLVLEPASSDAGVIRVLQRIATMRTVRAEIVLQTASYGAQVFSDPEHDALAERVIGDFVVGGGYRVAVHAQGRLAEPVHLSRGPDGTLEGRETDGTVTWGDVTRGRDLLLRTVYGGDDLIRDLAVVLAAATRVERKGTGTYEGNASFALRLGLAPESAVLRLVGDVKPATYVDNRIDLIASVDGLPLKMTTTYSYQTPAGRVLARQTITLTRHDEPVTLPSRTRTGPAIPRMPVDEGEREIVAP